MVYIPRSQIEHQFFNGNIFSFRQITIRQWGYTLFWYAGYAGVGEGMRGGGVFMGEGWGEASDEACSIKHPGCIASLMLEFSRRVIHVLTFALGSSQK